MTAPLGISTSHPRQDIPKFGDTRSSSFARSSTAGLLSSRSSSFTRNSSYCKGYRARVLLSDDDSDGDMVTEKKPTRDTATSPGAKEAANSEEREETVGRVVGEVEEEAVFTANPLWQRTGSSLESGPPSRRVSVDLVQMPSDIVKRRSSISHPAVALMPSVCDEGDSSLMSKVEIAQVTAADLGEADDEDDEEMHHHTPDAGKRKPQLKGKGQPGMGVVLGETEPREGSFVANPLWTKDAGAHLTPSRHDRKVSVDSVFLDLSLLQPDAPPSTAIQYEEHGPIVLGAVVGGMDKQEVRTSNPLFTKRVDNPSFTHHHVHRQSHERRISVDGVKMPTEAKAGTRTSIPEHAAVTTDVAVTTNPMFAQPEKANPRLSTEAVRRKSVSRVSVDAITMPADHSEIHEAPGSHLKNGDKGTDVAEHWVAPSLDSMTARQLNSDGHILYLSDGE